MQTQTHTHNTHTHTAHTPEYPEIHVQFPDPVLFVGQLTGAQLLTQSVVAELQVTVPE